MKHKKIYREDLIKRLFDFDQFFTTFNDHFKIFKGKYISIKGNPFDATVLFHKAAMVIRVGEDPLKTIIFDQLFFTLFWIKIS